MGIDFADIGKSIANVLAIGLILGAGLPALFAVGIRMIATGTASDDGPVVTHDNPGLRFVGYFLYAVVGAVIVLGILWITRQTLYHHMGIQIFPASAYK
ncbi:MAG: hypothetical protein WAW85_03825 [Gordonia sp. (in: high G+C Gram-positive bacteria)]|uniref:hypothetical protein n=1 Tax=Gordonia sp. (in: high G+C Gram-positive bacteria) TaxID=84139 RepID=UPI003BB604B5